MSYSKSIVVLVLDENDCETHRRDDWDTIQQASKWIRECGISEDYWYYASEVKDFASYAVKKIQLIVNGEIRGEWFPEFK